MPGITTPREWAATSTTPSTSPPRRFAQTNGITRSSAFWRTSGCKSCNGLLYSLNDEHQAHAGWDGVASGQCGSVAGGSTRAGGCAVGQSHAPAQVEASVSVCGLLRGDRAGLL